MDVRVGTERQQRRGSIAEEIGDAIEERHRGIEHPATLGGSRRRNSRSHSRSRRGSLRLPAQRHQFRVSKQLHNSGWRPPAVNAATPGAALRSKHMLCQAIDVHDPEGLIDNWLMTPQGQDALTKIGLWLEHPSATKGWSHWQTVPPGSGNRVFYP